MADVDEANAVGPMTLASPSFVLVLVHGTFASRAPWTQAGSRFRAVLEQKLGSVHFEPFEWTGANADKARRLAGGRLHEKLVELRARFPSALIYVVGHSHGGNVALYATQHDPQAVVAGVVAIATPFLHARVRKVPKSVAGLLFDVLMLPLLGFLFWVSTPVVVAILQLVGPVLVVSCATARLPRAIYCRFRFWVARRQNAIVRTLPWPLAACRILNLQISLDEARFHLTVLGFAANLLVASLASVPWIFLVGSALASASPVDTEPTDISKAGTVIAMSALIALLPLVCAAALGSIVIRGHRFGFGHNGIDNLFVDVRVAKQPLPRDTFIQETDETIPVPFHPHWGLMEYMVPAEYRHSRTLPRADVKCNEPEITNLQIASISAAGWIPVLRHSRLYDSVDIASTIAGWMLLDTVRRPAADQRELRT
jgi:pimeloyl-ACP methyl ester carboxylesterase